MRAIIWAALLCGLMFLGAVPARADWSRGQDFDALNELTWTTRPVEDAGAVVGPSGRTANGLRDSTAYWVSAWGGYWVTDLQIDVTIPPGCQINYFSVWYSVRRGNGSDAIIGFDWLLDGGTSHYGETIKSFDTWFELAGTIQPAQTASTLTLYVGFGQQSANDYVAFDDVAIGCAGDDPGGPGSGLTRPISPYDRFQEWDNLTEGMFDFETIRQEIEDIVVDTTPPWTATKISDAIIKPWNGNWNAVMALSNKTNASVLAAEGGTVQDLIPLEKWYCNQITTEGTLFTSLAYEQECYLIVRRYFIDDNPAIPDSYYRIDLTNAYFVPVDNPDGESVLYFVSSPTVQTGQVVEAGCIIGETMPVLGLTGIELESIGIGSGGDVSATFGGSGESGLGITILQRLDDQGAGVRLLPLLTEDRDALQACNINPNYSDCMGDGELRNPEQWAETGTVQWDVDGAGATLQPGAGIVQTLALSDQEEYGFSVRASSTVVGSKAEMLLLLGESQETFDVGVDMTYAIPVDSHTADAPPLYSVGIFNLSSIPIHVDSACVATNSAVEGIGACGFRNYDFDYGTSSWSPAGAVYDGITVGELAMGNGGSIRQRLQLYPNGAQQFSYTIRVLLANPWEGDSPSTDPRVRMTWTYGALSGFFTSPASTEYYSLTNFDYTPRPGGPFTAEGIYWQAVVNVNTPLDQDFVMTAGFLDQGTGAQIMIREACITSTFDHHPQPTGGTAGPPQIPIACSVVNAPTGSTIGEWIFYLWRNLDRFFTCDLMVLMNRMMNTMWSGYEYLQWSGMYSQASTSSAIRWLGNNLLPWLSGHFRNMAVGQVTVFQQAGGGQCSDVFCLLSQVANLLFSPISDLVNGFVGGLNNVLDTLMGILRDIVDTVLNLVNQAASLLFGIISALLTIALQIITEFIRLILMARDLLLALVGAYNNATPQTIQGMPNCQINPRNQGWCVFIYVVDNTLLAGARGTALIAIIISILSALLLIWGVKEIRNVVLKVRVSA